jgi:HlyD family secretion protein
MNAQESARAGNVETAEGKRWQAVAPGRVEPASGEIRIVPQVVGIVDELLVKTNDRVFAGEALVRLRDQEARARLAIAEVQIALRRRARNDENPNARAAARRRAEDAVWDAERAIVEARTTLDRVALERRAGRGTDADVQSAREALTHAYDRLNQQKDEYRKMEPDAQLPTQVEGQLAIARAEQLQAEAALEKLTLRAPLPGTILQMNARLGELASPSSSQPLVVLGDMSALRVRAELDERDFGGIKVGQAVVVRPEAFRDREIAGTVSSVASLVEPARIGARGQRSMTDVDIVEVMIDLTDPGPLAIGMKVDVYFPKDGAPR